jgi:hypothetical protein
MKMNTLVLFSLLAMFVGSAQAMGGAASDDSMESRLGKRARIEKTNEFETTSGEVQLTSQEADELRKQLLLSDGLHCRVDAALAFMSFGLYPFHSEMLLSKQERAIMRPLYGCLDKLPDGFALNFPGEYSPIPTQEASKQRHLDVLKLVLSAEKEAKRKGLDPLSRYIKGIREEVGKNLQYNQPRAA